MRRYTLASTEARSAVDLRDYKDVITNAVREVMAGVNNLKVVVTKDYYTVSPTPEKGDAIRIGRIICKSALNRHCVQIPKLFSSIEVKESDNGERKEHQMGGHM